MGKKPIRRLEYGGLAMLDIISVTFAISFTISLIGLFSLYYLKKLNPQSRIKKYFLINSGKSSTAAILLGGLPLAAAMILTIVLSSRLLTNFEISPQQLDILYRGLFASTILVFYGYLDDRFELRPIAKLAFQTITVLSFTLSTTALMTASHYSNIVFLLYCITGMALINGNNLLDGLDTLAIKTNITSFFAFAIMGYQIQSPLILSLSLAGIGVLCAFYFFNRNPAKVYLGEIGGTFFGFSYLILMGLYQHHQLHVTNTINLFFYAALPITLPVMELFVSFLRRILNNKSPFAGDRLHMHYIFTNNYKFSTAKATNIYALLNIAIISMSMWMYSFFSISASSIVAIAAVLWLGINHYVCHDFWTVSMNLQSPLRSIFNTIRKNNITLIDVNNVEEFEFKVIIDSGEQQSDDQKKAA